MEPWVGPAIVAAVISGLVSLIVVQLNFRQQRRGDRLRRLEKIRDFQIALRAEIRSELRNLAHHDIEEQLARVRQFYESRPDYAVTVPRPPESLVFRALVGEIHILPGRVIDPVVLFERQRAAIAQLADDMRDAGFRFHSREQQLAMYEDYLNMWSAWRDFALQAEAALDQ